MLGSARPSFGASVLGYRTRARLTQEELAALSGLSVRALRDLERGRASSAQERSAELLATAFGLTGDERASFLRQAEQGRRRSGRAGDTTLLHDLPDLPDLVGRETELDVLARETAAGGVVVVSGPPGVGKTSLAVAAIRRFGERFPDGCVGIDLRGGDDRPVSVGAALDRLLTTLGVPAARIPADTEMRGALFRTLVRERRMLVVLDNAANEAHVRPLLGAGPGSATIVTCRRTLAGLEAARWLVLDALSEEGAVDLIASIVGDDRVRDEPEAASALAALCGNLPLAVRIAGNRLAGGDRPMSRLVTELRDESARLDSLAAGDLRIRTVFEVSLRQLSPIAQTAFRRLALIPGTGFDDELASVVTGMSLDEAGPVLDELLEASLLSVTPRTNRLQFHDLLRLLAQERLLAEEPESVRTGLRDALHQHVLTRGAAAGRLFFAEVREIPADSPFCSLAEASDWITREESTWLPVLQQADALGRHREVLDFAVGTTRYSQSRELKHDWGAVCDAGLRAARVLGARPEEVDMLNQFSWLRSLAGADDEAQAASETAIAIAGEIGDRRGAMIAHCNLGLTLLRRHQVGDGMTHLRTAYEMSPEFDFFDLGIWMAIPYGYALLTVGRLDDALALHQAMLAEIDRRRGETNHDMETKAKTMAYAIAGDCFAAQSRWHEAAGSYRAARLALDDEQRVGYRDSAGLALSEGKAWRQAGEHAEARHCLDYALARFEGPLYGDERAAVEAELAALPA
ncbi:NB-ARC domain-containing protein [Lentzea sp. CA-135723]|uniref:NB-ARC domain-containing protein n=1 Tax=Lentzea sp. CA-135723 TaxID=3239950 RepID=UPI003D8EBEDA